MQVTTEKQQIGPTSTLNLSSDQISAKQEISKLVITYPRFKQALETITETIHYNKSTLAPEPSCVLVLGESGTGKTTLHQKVEEMMPKPYKEESEGEIVRKIPFFNTSVPTNATPSSMSEQILESMGMMGGSRYQVNQRLRVCLKQAETFGFNYDEFHNLALSKSPSKISSARGWVRDLITNTQVMVIGYGTDDCREIYLSEPQVHKRFPVILNLRPFEFSTDPKSDFAKTIMVFERTIGVHSNTFDSIEGRLNEDFLLRMYAATGGSINAIKKLYEMAVYLAYIKDGKFNQEKFREANFKMSFPNTVENGDDAFTLDSGRLKTRVANFITKRGY